MLKTVYGVWAEDEDTSYWLLFDSLIDAVSDRGEDAEIYELKAKYLGKFKLVTELRQLQKPKEKKKRKSHK